MSVVTAPYEVDGRIVGDDAINRAETQRDHRVMKNG